MGSIWLAPNVKNYSVAFCENLCVDAGVPKNVVVFMKTHIFKITKT